MRGLFDLALLAGAAILAIAAFWHVYWALGGRLGWARAIPQKADGTPAFMPGKTLTLGVAAMIAAVAALFWVEAEVASSRFPGIAGLWPAWLDVLALSATGSVFVLRAVGNLHSVGFFNRGGNAAFAVADRMVYSPLCLFLGLAGICSAALRLS